jgi:hypothetical protein
MSLYEAPEVDYDSHGELQGLESTLFRLIRGFVRGRVNHHLGYWQRWPYIASLGMDDVGPLYLMTYTKGRGEEWCRKNAMEIQELLLEVITGVVTFARRRNTVVTVEDLHEVLDDTITNAISARVRAVMVKNIVLVSRVHPVLTPRFSYDESMFYSWPEIFALRLAAAMGGHARLGEGSGLLSLDSAILRGVVIDAYAPSWPFFGS